MSLDSLTLTLGTRMQKKNHFNFAAAVVAVGCADASG